MTMIIPSALILLLSIVGGIFANEDGYDCKNKPDARSGPALLQVSSSPMSSDSGSEAASKSLLSEGKSISHAELSDMFLKIVASPDEDAVTVELEKAIRGTGEKILEGHSDDHGALIKQTNQYDQWAADDSVKTICETGFNAGHSAARFLSQSKARVYEFDLGDHDYAKTAEAFLTDKFPGRLKVTWGDSTQTLPQFHKENPDIKCDIVIVDGGHLLPVALADLKNFAPMASPRHVLAIDDTPCQEDFCKGPSASWQGLLQQGCIEETGSVSMGASRGFKYGRYAPCPQWPNMGKSQGASSK